VRRFSLCLCALAAVALTLSACGENTSPPPPQSSTPTAVTVVRATAEEVRPSTTFTGRIEAKDKVDLRARVDGFLEKRLFTEGADVKEGQPLFAIEKGLYQAAVNQAAAGVEQAQATLKLADLEVDRQAELVRRNVGTQARLDEVTGKQGEARGALLAQKAALEKAQLQLSYTNVSAPISGRIGRSNISVGNFVSSASGTLATIVRQDPIYVNFPVTQREILEVRKTQNGKPGEYTIFLRLADGSRYTHPGRLDFVDVTVSQGTDTVLVRAEFPNPDRLLVDGQLVSVVVELGRGESALQVPQQALQADQSGAYVLVVDKDGKVEVRRVETGPGGDGINIAIRKGLEQGERVITEGVQKVRPGQHVEASEVKPGA
jgi:membrane fusion protein, multidrug efflux system